MSRAIHKLRGPLHISVLIENFGNVSGTTGTSHTFTGNAVGSGGGRTIIVLGSMEDTNVGSAEITTCTVGGTSCDRRAEARNGSGRANGVSIFVLKLTSETGDVDIVLGSGNSLDSWGMSYIVVNAMQSTIPTDTAVGNANSTSVATSSTLEGAAGGISVGVTSHGNRPDAHTWGSSMTEKADLESGNQSDSHRHSIAFDLLPGGRSASTETVTSTGSGRFALATATFR